MDRVQKQKYASPCISSWSAKSLNQIVAKMSGGGPGPFNPELPNGCSVKDFSGASRSISHKFLIYDGTTIIDAVVGLSLSSERVTAMKKFLDFNISAYAQAYKEGNVEVLRDVIVGTVLECNSEGTELKYSFPDTKFAYWPNPSYEPDYELARGALFVAKQTLKHLSSVPSEIKPFLDAASIILFLMDCGPKDISETYRIIRNATLLEGKYVLESMNVDSYFHKASRGLWSSKVDFSIVCLEEVVSNIAIFFTVWNGEEYKDKALSSKRDSVELLSIEDMGIAVSFKVFDESQFHLSDSNYDDFVAAIRCELFKSESIVNVYDAVLRDSKNTKYDKSTLEGFKQSIDRQQARIDNLEALMKDASNETTFDSSRSSFISRMEKLAPEYFD